MIKTSSIIGEIKSSSLKLKNKKDLVLLRSKYLGKKSLLASEMADLVKLKGAQRAKLGRELNTLKESIEAVLTSAQTRLEDLENQTQYQPFDISSPGESLSSESRVGHLHPVSLVLKETYQIFTELGFAIVDSLEIETDWYNFEALNMPDIHPAREMQDTFYIKGSNKKLLPRTHTSGMQVRFMLENKPPFKIIVPGKVFRSENEDATHSWSFNQIEGLVVGEGVSMANLKGVLLQIVKRQLGKETEIRFRPSYFPYTEPSVEVDAKYNGKWLELGGAGMVHPEVLARCGIDPDKYSGFAFGWGVERIAAIKYNISDLRQMWRPKIEFLEQF
ncbi:phenylalanine--tRNA ligase subunit alpha [Candidatus Saccharibacteria bacterium]|nr:phenylalanine--tRNA ligase subunit alpha [Candidatus Saccharibacteria bacterium]